MTPDDDLRALAPLRRTVGALLGLLVALAVGFALLPTHDVSAAGVGLCNAAVAAVGAWCAWRRGRAEPSARVGWWVMAGSLMLFSPAQVAAVAPFLGIGAPTVFPTNGDLVSLAFLPLAAVSMLLWRAPAERPGVRVRSMVDGLLFAVATFFLMWDAALGTRDLGLVSRPMLLCALGFFIGSSINLGVAIHLAGRNRDRWGGPLGFLVAGFVLVAANGVGIVLSGLGGHFHTGHPVDLLAVVAGAIGTVGFLSSRPSLAPARAEASSSWAADLAPYGPLMAVLVVLVVRAAVFGYRQDRVEDLLALLLVVIIAARQFLAIRDVRQLSRTLEAKVVERTRQLEHSQAALMRAQRLEALGQMSGGVAHDFNNLLTVVGTSAQMARRVVGDRGLKELDTIEAAVDRAGGLTRQLLAFARKQPTEARRFDVNSLLRELEPLLSRLAVRDCEVELKLGALGAGVEADPAQIEQLLVNLVANARDAMPDGGTVTLATAMRDLTGGEELPLDAGRYVVIAVRDQGSGMPPEVAERAFEPFFTTKGPGGGTGLGLATCWGIVRQADGHLAIETPPDGGTEIRVYLPARSMDDDSGPSPAANADDVPSKGRSAEAAEATEATEGQGRTRSVLVADDTAELRAVMARILREEGYRVLEAPDGLAAAEQASRHEGTIDLLVTDLVMPRLSGLELAERMRAMYPDIQVLTVTGYADELPELPAKSTLLKPFSPEELLQRVRSLLPE